MAFVEERLATGFRFGSSHGEKYAVEVVEQMLNRYATLRHPYVMSTFEMEFKENVADQITKTVDLFHRVGGRTNGFRLKNPNDYTTNGYTGTPTARDQLTVVVSAAAKTYQITRWYGTAGGSDSPRRKIKKPVSGTVKASIYDGAWNDLTLGVDFTVDTTTGIITLTNPLITGETLYAGCEYDIPVVFETDLSDIEFNTENVMINTIRLREILNP